MGELVFPMSISLLSGGIKRRRLGECAPVYLAAVIHSALKIQSFVLCMLLLFCISLNQVLEYMTAELVEAAGEEGESEEQEAGSAHDQPKPYRAGGE